MPRTNFLEHANISVTDPKDTAALMCRLFNWHIRWSGPATSDGQTVHVGTDESYIALYAPDTKLGKRVESYTTVAGLNHLGIVVDDLDAVEQRVLDEGFSVDAYADYEPGRRFYFHTNEGLEIEVVSYASDS